MGQARHGVSTGGAVSQRKVGKVGRGCLLGRGHTKMGMLGYIVVIQYCTNTIYIGQTLNHH